MVSTPPSARSWFEPLEERRRLRRRAHVCIGKDHRAVQRSGIRCSIEVRAISLPPARPLAEAHVPYLIDGGPLARSAKLRRKLARYRGLLWSISNLTPDFRASRTDQLLQLILRVEPQVHLLRVHVRRLLGGLSPSHCGVFPIDAGGGQCVHTFKTRRTWLGSICKVHFEGIALDATRPSRSCGTTRSQSDAAARGKEAWGIQTRGKIHFGASGLKRILTGG